MDPRGGDGQQSGPLDAGDDIVHRGELEVVGVGRECLEAHLGPEPVRDPGDVKLCARLDREAREPVPDLLAGQVHGGDPGDRVPAELGKPRQGPAQSVVDPAGQAKLLAGAALALAEAGSTTDAIELAGQARAAAAALPEGMARLREGLAAAKSLARAGDTDQAEAAARALNGPPRPGSGTRSPKSPRQPPAPGISRAPSRSPDRSPVPSGAAPSLPDSRETG